MRKSLSIILGLCALALCPSVWAVCSGGSGVKITTIAVPPTLGLKRDMAAGTLLWDSGWVNQGGSSGPVDNCDGNSVSTEGLQNFFTLVSAGGQSNVAKTNIPGVGMRLSWCNSGNAGSAYCSSGGDRLTTGSKIIFGSVTGGNYYPTAMFKMEIVRTSEPVNLSGGSQLVLPTLVDVWYASINVNRLIVSGTSTIQSQGCQIGAGGNNIVVRMPSVRLSDFAGVGVLTNASKAAPFEINLLCDANIKVSYQVDAQGGVTVTNVINNSTGSGRATGVGIQLFQGAASSTTVLPLGSKTLYTTTAGSAQGVSIPLTAKYYKTQTSMTAGLVRASATFTLYYE
ncbi:fimbrial protein [Pseudomonas panipatensis]|uniref:Pilin (Type 1 fimbria component protein) n=1 Tax=Pseudomonas panipatensis TaxID=428992 RepID=A0A1G8EI35_9PSED|nr:fimbrial protein [Pseudomonas panipatensis]SDH69537.1 Pilin (type 1 fimbria component protein) [Pseudomonas panipatensis]SMP68043.1 Pilin (type 1 fimbria component protein) [Pseudomonas panipatensis]